MFRLLPLVRKPSKRNEAIATPSMSVIAGDGSKGSRPNAKAVEYIASQGGSSVSVATYIGDDQYGNPQTVTGYPVPAANAEAIMAEAWKIQVASAATVSQALLSRDERKQVKAALANHTFANLPEDLRERAIEAARQKAQNATKNAQTLEELVA